MKRIFIFTTILLLQTIAICQDSWQKSIDNYAPFGYNFIEKADSNGWYLISGSKSYSNAQSKGEIIISRYDKCGNVRWSYRYANDTVSMKISDVLKDNAGNIVITGYYYFSPDYTQGHIFVMKANAQGVILWYKHYDIDGIGYPYSIGQMKDGSYFVYYMYDKVPAITPFNCILKINQSGGIIWNKGYYLNPIWGSAIATSDGGILVQSGHLFYKLNSTGNILWSNIYLGIYYCSKPIEVNGNYIFAQYPTSSSTDSLCYLFSLTSNGTLGFTSQAFKGSSVKDIIRLSNGNALVYGTVFVNPGHLNQVCLTEINSTGIIQNQKIIQSTNLAQPWFSGSVCELNNHTLIMTSAIQNATPHPYQNSLTISKSRNLTDFGCTVPFSGILTQTPVNTVMAPGSLANGFTPTDINIPYTRTAIQTSHTISCFVADTNKINLGNDTTLCNGKSMILNANLGNAYSYLWSTGATTPSITVNQPGTYWVKAFICDTIYDTIQIHYSAPLTLNFQVSPLLTKTLIPVSFNNYTSPISFVQWNTGDGNIFNINNFQHAYAEGGIYNVILTVKDTNNCSYSASLNVVVDEYTFYIPNSFTPNGDGVNDEFKPLGTGIEEWKLIIYNRWGEEIFEGKDIGWDGLLRGNTPAPEGVYSYLIELKNAIGSRSIRKGNLTLIRSNR